jgi:peptide/nickel transport system ATP-binding protein
MVDPLVLKNVSVAYSVGGRDAVAVSNVSLTIHRGEIFGLLGESGSGKSTLAFAVMRLLQGGARLIEGEISVLGQNVYDMEPEALRSFRWRNISMVFQSAMNALNPVLTIEQHMEDTLRSHDPTISRPKIRDRINEVLDLVNIDRQRAKSFPHELSGGMKQRVVLAIAMIFNPPVLLMDEPTTALDVVVQRSILDQVRTIQADRQMAILFVSHDFSLVRSIAHRIAIMYAGRMVEVTDRLDHSAVHHPYTEGLMRAIPELDASGVTIDGIPGSPPDLLKLPSGCAFHPRCPDVFKPCAVSRPVSTQLDHSLIECHKFTMNTEDHSDA